MNVEHYGVFLIFKICLFVIWAVIHTYFPFHPKGKYVILSIYRIASIVYPLDWDSDSRRMKPILIMYHRLKCLTLHAGLALGILFRQRGKDDIHNVNYSSNPQLIKACIKICPVLRRYFEVFPRCVGGSFFLLMFAELNCPDLVRRTEF